MQIPELRPFTFAWWQSPPRGSGGPNWPVTDEADDVDTPCAPPTPTETTEVGAADA